jgi:hypothetical protein
LLYLQATAPAPDLSVEPELENTNESPQGKRLEKEWSALSQCRALKRSSEVSYLLPSQQIWFTTT